MNLLPFPETRGLATIDADLPSSRPKVLMSCKVAAAVILVAALPVIPAPVEAGPSKGIELQIDACALLDSAEISDVVDFPVDKGRRRDAGYESDGAYSSACVWIIGTTDSTETDFAAPLTGRHFAMLHVMRWPDGSEQSGKYLQAFRDAALHGEIPSDPVPREVGDEALWWGDGLAVRQGDTSFGLSVFLPDSESAGPGVFEELLAPLVARRLALAGTSSP